MRGGSSQGCRRARARPTKNYDWRYAHPLKEGAFAVETMPNDAGDTFVLVLDPKTEVETSFSMSASTALALGLRLIEAADGASPPKPVTAD